MTALALLAAALAAAPLSPAHPGPMLDAHNCYPYDGQWSDRLRRALDAGFPVSIEQDLAWYVDPATGKGRIVVSHSADPTGAEPTLDAYFFDQVRPIVEKALRQNHRADWPLIVLHFDFKSNDPALLKAVWALLGRYQPWLATAAKTADPDQLSPIDLKPILVVTEDSDAQAKVFYDDVPVGGRLRLFGSAHSSEAPTGLSEAQRAHWEATASPGQLLPSRATNYRRWWNNSWSVVEQGGQRNAGAWTKADDQRLRALVDHAHRQGYWIRFYTLDGFDAAEDKGWDPSYNFGALGKAEPRWKAAIAAGVDFIATDQYEALGHKLDQRDTALRPNR
ncbi:hypothetical protein [Hephaestia mangrovi]|uniref:hypothetical protein n=1 Tax=Hephaestia mangrovi TaxID=2873268 RepID=UPI001CA78FCA|nr:hypothetical protein [Hephaestia mangrovi]MBY8827241.1 hypothetical protein [Hephaestia mangrovi]